MFATIKELFRPTNKDLRKRIWFTLFALSIFALGTNIVVPVEGAGRITSDLGFLELLSIMSGGGLKSYSIFALGVMPYISASFITQFFQTDIFPFFKELKEQGYQGRQKMNAITRYMGIGFAFVQGYVFSIGFMGSVGTIAVIKSTIILAAGTAFLLWLGDQITTKGIGNGISLIIMAGILNTTPAMFIHAFESLVTKNPNELMGIISFAIFVVVYLTIIVGIIWIQLAERRIPIQYSNRTHGAYGGQQNFLPIKLNSAGVMPVIFASTLIGIPSFIAQVVKKPSFVSFVENYISYTTVTGFILYVVLILFFEIAFTYITLNPEDMAKNLNQNGGYIPGTRPGKDTQDFIGKVLLRLSVVGGLFIVVIATLPIIFSAISKLPSTVTIGGTGLLIVVGVAMETYKQLESSIVSRSYKTKRRSTR